MPDAPLAAAADVIVNIIIGFSFGFGISVILIIIIIIIVGLASTWPFLGGHSTTLSAERF